MLRRVALVRTDVSEQLGDSFIRVTRIGELGTMLAVFLVHWFLWPWSMRRRVPPKYRSLQKPHGVTSQKTPFFRTTGDNKSLDISPEAVKASSYLDIRLKLFMKGNLSQHIRCPSRDTNPAHLPQHFTLLGSACAGRKQFLQRVPCSCNHHYSSICNAIPFKFK
jgi:hypothetical protein